MENLNELLAAELIRESENTRKMLELVPEDKIEWRPHEKSFALGRLASHVAELPNWVNRALEADEYDMAAHPYKSTVYPTQKELMEAFEQKLEAALVTLKNVSNEKMAEQWVFRRGDYVISKASKYDTIRSWMLNHQVHHRGQLSVYLRMLDVPIPGMYGPSADDVLKRQAAAEAAK